MKRALLAAGLLAGCLDFQTATEACVRSGHCIADGGGANGGGAAGGSGGGVAGGGTAGGSGGGLAGGGTGGGAGGGAMGGGLGGGAQTDAGVDAGTDAGTDPCSRGIWCVVDQVPGSPLVGYAVWGATPNDVWVVGGSGTFVRRFVNGVAVDAGTVPGASGSLFAVTGRSSSDVWAVGFMGKRVHFDGVSWAADDDAQGKSFFGVAAASDDVVAVGSNDLARLRHGDGGWQVVNPGSSTDLDSVWLSSDGGTGWATRASGDLLRWTNGGWANLQPPNPSAVELWSSSGWDVNDVWVVGDEGIVLRFNGTAWTGRVPSSPANEHLYGVSASGPDDAWACGANGRLQHMTGAMLTSVDAGTGVRFSGIKAFPGGEVWVVGAERTVLRYRP